MDYHVTKYNGRPMSSSEIHDALVRIISGNAPRRIILERGCLTFNKYQEKYDVLFDTSISYRLNVKTLSSHMLFEHRNDLYSYTLPTSSYSEVRYY